MVVRKRRLEIDVQIGVFDARCSGPDPCAPAMRSLPIRPLVTLALLVGAVGCTATRDAALPLVRIHATKDLVCPEEKIAIERLLGGRYVATGCGRRATYHSACEHLRCTVGQAGEEPPVWRDRPEPGVH